MGLRFRDDLAAWQRWQDSRSLRSRLLPRIGRGHMEHEFVLMTNRPQPRLLVLIEAAKPSTVAAYAAPLRFLSDESVAILAPSDVRHLLEGEWRLNPVSGREVPDALREVRAVLAAGHYLPAGRLGYEWSQTLGARFVTAQHGLMTPFAPPLARGTHLLAFSEQDADFWKSGRTDVSHETVGAQILWKAAHARGERTPARESAPVFLGQLHGAELPRRISAKTARQFCMNNAADYRPHPSETDRLSRFQHSLWRRQGVKFERSGLALDELRRPVVSVFSTGVLEAAASGQHAWVTCSDPPAWIRDFWARYGLNQWGQEPTPAPSVPELEPAQATAASLARILEGEK